ncbi:hypothetical protein WBP06_04235 [Novosphingobium sp. BL-8H]|uniref:hypothetical protein n=1 Tax=Novosphingobium sp. BL-8H TaxID=3127640 RepID=UPI0037571FFF
MKGRNWAILLVLIEGLTSAAHGAPAAIEKSAAEQSAVGRYSVATIPFDAAMQVRSATFTPSGKVLVSYAPSDERNERRITLATMDDDGRNLRPFFSGTVPDRPGDNGLRYMVFPDNKRIFLGDFVAECPTVLENCKQATLVPVDYPTEVAGGASISHRWSEIVVAPDNEHVAWTTLLANYSAMVFTGRLERSGDRYRIADTRIVSTLDPFVPDPRHADGVLPQPVLGGEVKQFVHGGKALSLAGAADHDLPDSVTQDLASGRKVAVTSTPGYTETTIFSPDERLGLTMTTRFSEKSGLAILGLVPRPYPDSLNMGLSMLAYTYSVTGVRQDRLGNVGPALIDIAASMKGGGYLGTDLAANDDWVFRSPMSWHPGGRKAMWPEGRRTDGAVRIRMVTLPDYRPGKPPATVATPADRTGSTDLSLVAQYARKSQDIDVKVYGKASGYIVYRRTPGGEIGKTYVNFADDPRQVYSGTETMKANPRGRSTYTAKLQVIGERPATMDLTMMFGPLSGRMPARLLFDPDENGVPLSHGFAEYAGKRLDVSSLIP